MCEKILLIDGNSIINRAFYAIPLLSDKEGRYTNAVYGFLNIFFKFFDEENPKYAAVAFDLPHPTFRHEKYAEYKGTRKKMPDELASQLPILKELLGKMNIKIIEKEGFEADDILGTMAVKASSNGIFPVIISGDRDLLQIASNKIKIRIPKTKGGKTEVEDYLEKDVLEKYGVTPKEFIEVKALMGDSSDNVPGVPSIGEKTAIKIIQEYKTVENAIKNSENIKPKKASENLKEYEQQALLSKYLVTINVNVPLDIKENEFTVDGIYNEKSFEMFSKLGFKSMLNRFDVLNVKKETDVKTNFKLINEDTEAKNFFFNLNPFDEISYCIAEEDGNIFGISFSLSDESVFIKTGEGIKESELFEITRNFFEGEYPKIAHDAKRDITILRKYNIKLNNLIFDTMIAAYILNATKETYNYNDIAFEFLNESYKSEEDIFGKGKSHKKLNEVSESEVIKFFCLKSDVSLRAKEFMLNKIELNNQHELFYNIEIPLIYVLADMESNGIKANRQGILNYRDELKTKIDELTKEIYWLAGEEFNINSPKQLSVILFEKLGLKGGKKTKTGWSTSAGVLDKLKGKDEIVDKVLEYRTYVKLKTTYADGLLSVLKDDDKIYSTFNQTITSTGRISSTEPNLQNIPIKLELGRKLRKVFIPSSTDYIFIDGDYSQIELRVLAHMAGDKTLINAFIEGQDIHKLTASQVFNVDFDSVTPIQRSNAKAVNFGIIYGIGAFSLSQDLGISKREADLYIDGYFKKYPFVKAYLNEIVEKAKINGYAETIFNRRREIPEINDTNFVKRSFGERVAMNMPIQGTAADIIKIAMIQVHKKLLEHGLRAKLILQVHDELLLEVHKQDAPKAAQLLKQTMEQAVNLSVPMFVEVHQGNSWFETK